MVACDVFVLFTSNELNCGAYDGSIMTSRMKLLFKLFIRLMQILLEHTTASIYSEMCMCV